MTVRELISLVKCTIYSASLFKMNLVLDLLELYVEIREFVSHPDEMKNAKEIADHFTFLKW